MPTTAGSTPITRFRSPRTATRGTWAFRSLRVMNEDFVAPGQGFGTHPHDNMEIVTYVLEGALEHRDSMGNGEVLRPGEFQRMSAGTGITHSEFNPSAAEPVHLYQIWLLPEQQGHRAKLRAEAVRRRRASQSPAAGGVARRGRGVAADPPGRAVFLATLEDGREVSHSLGEGRHAWLQVLRGKASLNGQDLSTSDGAAVSDERLMRIESQGGAEVMLFDLK